MGPVLMLSPQSLDWGTVPVLCYVNKQVTITNESQIDACFSAFMASKPRHSLLSAVATAVLSSAEIFFCFFFFFFQAEDGIRDFCLSRGLGDVYKRQLILLGS